MRSTQQFSVTLPCEMAALVRAKVASGEYASESDDWLQQQALNAYDAYSADPSRGIALEEVRASIGKRSSGARSED